MNTLTPKQTRVMEFIAKFIRRTGYSPTLDEIAAHLRITKATVQQYLSALEKKDVIARQHYVHRSIEMLEPAFADREAHGIPLSGSIAAGRPIEAIETAERVDMNEMLGLKGTRNIFLLLVEGNSMIEDGIFDGDYVVVERTDTAENGQTVVALLPDGTATLKRIYRERGTIRLQPANPSLEPMYVSEVEVQGIVRGVVRPM